MVPIIVPLFVAAIRRANDLAMAMESRCYHGGVGRTKLKPLKYEKRDKIAYIVLFVFFSSDDLFILFQSMEVRYDETSKINRSL